jgi:hypothetical protein
MAKLTLERDLTKPTSSREEEEADLLMAAVIDGDTHYVERALTENPTIRRLIERGAIRIFTDQIFG